MTDPKTDPKTQRLPRRDAQGRIVTLPDLLGTALAGVVIGVLVLVVFDAAFAVSGLGTFGRANGWLGLVLPVWLFVEEFRAWRGGAARIVAALAALAAGLVTGMLAAGVAGDLPVLGSGALGAVVFTVSYALVWFVGVRWLDHRTG